MGWGEEAEECLSKEEALQPWQNCLLSNNTLYIAAKIFRGEGEGVLTVISMINQSSTGKNFHANFMIHYYSSTAHTTLHTVERGAKQRCVLKH